MKTQLLATLLVSSSLLGGCSNLSAESESTMNISNKTKAVALLNAIETGDSKAISYVNASDYTQHNLAIADGLAGFGEALQAQPKGSAKVNVERVFEDGDYVFTHTNYNFFGPKVGFDLFRFENGQIVEHWDNLAQKAQQANPSGRTQLDGVTTVLDLDKTAENKALVAGFVETILINAEYDKLTKYFDGDHYLQHNTAIADGVSGLGQAIEAMGQQGITMEYDKAFKILGEGNFVLAISEGRFAGKPTSYYDLFRIENGKIAEHWDVMETILNKEQWKNANGKFGNL
ncbi:nuclear transport factor 2 family protein [Shewanella gelidimarina]|uniref:nuclear transport factor 2 family protein n=1 Tax=Shewanella gelidimarina TaxID=56813 RepID=UPI00200E9E79|nr:nuclear transport factor 2 family protein [Shewanella gelidimarina]MCL1056790.1 nuclear transport factor 2 family protein [Shewanella gelidimarina]